MLKVCTISPIDEFSATLDKIRELEKSKMAAAAILDLLPSLIGLALQLTVELSSNFVH